MSVSLSWSTSRRSTILSAALAVISAVVGIIGFFLANHSDRAGVDVVLQHQFKRAEVAQRAAEKAEAKAKQAEAEVNHLNQLLQESRKTPTGRPRAELDPADRQALAESRETQQQLTSRLSALEGALSSDPVKALTLPLLRKDFDTLQDREKTDLDAIRGELGRLYNFGQWFMGLVITIALALFTLAIGNLRRPPEKKEP